MSDDVWRGKKRDRDEDDFGPPLFGDPSEPTNRPTLSFDDNTGPLPHWTSLAMSGARRRRLSSRTWISRCENQHSRIMALNGVQ